MAIPYLCILVAALLPYAATALAKSRMPLRANAAPREHLDTETGWRKRALYAERNSFEAFPFFAAAVLVALQREAPLGTISAWSIAFVAFRIAYLIAYVVNTPSLRSLLWTGGIVSCVALFFV